MYKVIVDFVDMCDGGFLYHAGDSFPRDGAEVSAARASLLLSNSNRLGTPLIEEIVNPVRESEKAARTAENEPEKAPEAVERPKRTRRKK